MDLGKHFFGEWNKVIRLLQEEKGTNDEKLVNLNSEFLRGLCIK